MAFEVVDEWQGRGVGRRSPPARGPRPRPGNPAVPSSADRAATGPRSRSSAALATSCHAASEAATSSSSSASRAENTSVRIIAGSKRGARIAAPKGLATRPTGDRVREAAFNLIGPVDGAARARPLRRLGRDGARGALARRAARVFVESDRAACRAIQQNLEKLRLTGARVVCARRRSTLRAGAAAGRYDLVLVDPPYEALGRARGAARRRYLPRVLARRTASSSSRPRAHRAGASARPCVTSRRYGSARITLFAPDDHCDLPRLVRPGHVGHVDVIGRAAAIFDRVVVGVVREPAPQADAVHASRSASHSSRRPLAEHDNVEVDVFSELVVDFARQRDAKTMVKGLRVISDFEWEFQMNQLNRTLAPEIETVYVMASPQYSFVSSSGVKEIAVVRRKGGRAGARGRGAPLRGDVPERPTRRSLRTRRSRLASRMDVLVLIDKLDDLVHNAKAVPLTDQVRIDREEIYDILDQMRATIPEEIKQARWIVKERQEMLAEAKRECDRLIGEAREQAVREASQTEIVKIAERQAQDIVDDARRQARETRLEMEDWADGILSTLEVNLDKFLVAVRRGRERLHERSQETVMSGIGPIEPVGRPRRRRQHGAAELPLVPAEG